MAHRITAKSANKDTPSTQSKIFRCPSDCHLEGFCTLWVFRHRIKQPSESSKHRFRDDLRRHFAIFRSQCTGILYHHAQKGGNMTLVKLISPSGRKLAFLYASVLQRQLCHLQDSKHLLMKPFGNVLFEATLRSGRNHLSLMIWSPPALFSAPPCSKPSLYDWRYKQTQKHFPHNCFAQVSLMAALHAAKPCESPA